MGGIISVEVPGGGAFPLDITAQRASIADRVSADITAMTSNPDYDPWKAREFEAYLLGRGLSAQAALAKAVELANVRVDWAEFELEHGLRPEGE